MKQSSLTHHAKVCAIITLACHAFILTPQVLLAESKSIRDQVADWILEGVTPQPPTNPDCSEGGRDYLGHLGERASTSILDGMIDQACRARVNQRTDTAPFLIFGCYTTDVPPDLLSYPAYERRCYCDYFFCDTSNYAPYEQLVEFAVDAADLLGFE